MSRITTPGELSAHCSGCGWYMGHADDCPVGYLPERGGSRFEVIAGETLTTYSTATDAVEVFDKAALAGIPALLCLGDCVVEACNGMTACVSRRAREDFRIALALAIEVEDK